MATRQRVANYSWTSLVSSAPVTVPAASKVLLGTLVLSTAFEETLTRARGRYSVSSDQAAAIEEQVGAIGLIRVTDLAVTAGVTSIPSPVFDGSDDGWSLWSGFSQSRTVADAFNSETYEVDSKAQRIVRQGQQLALVVENGHATDGLRIMVSFRFLARFRS